MNLFRLFISGASSPDSGGDEVHDPAARKARFETLEARILLSADPTGPLDPGVEAAGEPAAAEISQPALAIESVEVTPSAVVMRFNAPFDPDALNLYDTENDGRGPADVTVVGDATGSVRGSLLIGTDRLSMTFVATGRFPADTFTLSVSGGVDGLRDVNGVAGDDFVTRFTVSETTGLVVSLPDMARGPGQSVDLPADAAGIPIRLSDSEGVTSVDLVLRYDPALLTINGASPGGALPDGSTVTTDLSVDGEVTIGIIAASPLGTGLTEIVTLDASVPITAPYGAKHILDITNVSVNGGDIPAIADDGLHLVTYLGDATGNAGLSSLDALGPARVAVGLDSGLGPFSPSSIRPSSPPSRAHRR